MRAGPRISKGHALPGLCQRARFDQTIEAARQGACDLNHSSARHWSVRGLRVIPVVGAKSGSLESFPCGNQHGAHRIKLRCHQQGDEIHAGIEAAGRSIEPFQAGLLDEPAREFGEGEAGNCDADQSTGEQVCWEMNSKVDEREADNKNGVKVSDDSQFARDEE